MICFNILHPASLNVCFILQICILKNPLRCIVPNRGWGEPVIGVVDVFSNSCTGNDKDDIGIVVDGDGDGLRLKLGVG